ncbi:MAG: selenium-dependent xanthine dehydrogenase [Synergistaceae bacterium]|jgi:selenium-dependent xanthine dehydrogenase|nr:selenium-dependent xanthine dehydrogenase [Synergistaceae bacterium]
MYKLIVNGNIQISETNRKLIDFLREDLSLTSVKNGCKEGACGTCMVLIDGKPCKSCVQELKNLEGKSIVTVEGLSAREKDVYSYSFSVSGAVQCGFCTPGTVISAKALLDREKDPTRKDVKNAIKNNICRCTGYKKIEDAVLLAAKMFREDLPVPKDHYTGRVGENVPRTDAAAKVLGTAQYAADIKIDGMIYGSALRAEYPRAIVRSIDTSEAMKLEGVVGVFTAKDIPGKKKIGHLVKDWDVMIPEGGSTRYVGDAIALVAAETPEILEEAKKLIKVDYEVLKPVTSPVEALAEGAPLIHEGGNILSVVELKRGNADEAIKNSAHVVTNRYSLPFTEHAFLEPETAVALMEDDGTVRIYSADQGVYQTMKECSEALGLPHEKVRVTAVMIGGGFGGKEDMSVQHHAALLAYLTGRPVKVSLSRADSIKVHPKRHAMEIEMTTACDGEGRLTAMKAVIVSDTGAYASLGGPVLQRACTHAAGPYNYHNIDIKGTAVYTNNPPAGAFRGFGVTQSCFAAECNINLLAEKVGLSPWEFRFKNAIRPGEELPNGQIADDTTALEEVLLAIKDEYDKNPKAGISCAMKNAGLGVGVPDFGRCRLRIRDGKVHIATSASCIGQGLGTVVTQMVCDVTGLFPELVVHDPADTFLTPDSGNTTASRQTVITGEAVRKAAEQLKKDMETVPFHDLEGREYYAEFESVTDKMGSDKPHPVSHISYGYAAHLVILDDDGRIKKITAAHDVGRAINPKNVEGQIEGGVVMSMGYALTENYPLKNCVPQAKFGTLGLFRADMVPDIESIVIGKAKDGFARGAKGIGEIAAIPGAPAIQLAYYNRDGIFRTSLPLKDTPYSKNTK